MSFRTAAFADEAAGDLDGQIPRQTAIHNQLSADSIILPSESLLSRCVRAGFRMSISFFSLFYIFT